MTEDALYAVSGIVGVLVGLLCYRRIYRDGKSRRQRRAERWAARGGVAEGVSTSVERLCAGDLDARAPEERRYRSRYHYRVGGRTYTAFLRALDEYPARVTVYYNPERPEEHVVGNEITEPARRGRGCLISVLLTLLSTGASGAVLVRLFMR